MSSMAFDSLAIADMPLRCKPRLFRQQGPIEIFDECCVPAKHSADIFADIRILQIKETRDFASV